MISLILLIICILLLITILPYVFYKLYKKQTLTYTEESNLTDLKLLVLFCLMAFGLIIILLVRDIQRANKLKAEIEIMSPVTVNLAILKRTELEYAVVTNLIKETFDKYQIQATTVDFKGMTMFASPLAGNSLKGVGDIERGSGEKLKNLEQLINKQWELADKLIELEKESYKPEFYKLNQSLHVIKHNVFTGLFVRHFMAKKINLVYNETYYAKGVQINN